MDTTIPAAYYTLTPSTKTIALLPPYNTLTIEQINNIHNVTKNIEIYDSRNPRKRRQFKGEVGPDITVSNGVISYIEEAGMENSDKIKIMTDIAMVTTNGVSSGPSVITVNTTNLFSSQTISANGTANSTGAVTGACTKLNVYCKNIGTSTNCTITIYGSPTSALTTSKILGIVKLGANASGGVVIPSDGISAYTWASVSNGDVANTAIILVTLEMFTGASTISNTYLFNAQSISASGSANSSAFYSGASGRVNAYCKNTGTSTNCTITIYGSPYVTLSPVEVVATCTLGANGIWGGGILKDIIPSYLYAVVSNSDTVNPATATVLIESFT